MSDVLDVTTTCLNAIRELPASDRRRVVTALTALLDLTAPLLRYEGLAIPGAPLAVRLVEERSPKDPPVKEKPAPKPSPKASRGGKKSPLTRQLLEQIPRLLSGGPAKVADLARTIGVENRSVIDALKYLQADGTVIGEGFTTKRVFSLPGQTP